LITATLQEPKYSKNQDIMGLVGFTSETNSFQSAFLEKRKIFNICRYLGTFSTGLLKLKCLTVAFPKKETPFININFKVR